MAKYLVCFDGKWQEDFGDREEALYWAQEVGETGRLVYVAQVRVIRPLKLIAVFPVERADEGRWIWGIRTGVPGQEKDRPRSHEHPTVPSK